MMFDNSPYYHRPKTGSSLVDKVTNSYDSLVDKAKYASKISYGCMIDDLNHVGLGKPVDKIFKKTGNYLYKNKNLITSFIAATGGSVAVNMATTYICDHVLSLPSDTVANWSYGFEMASYTGLFTWNYWHKGKKEGVPKERLCKELAVMGVTGFAMSFFAYKPARYETIDYAVKTFKMARYLASGATQFAATCAFYFIFKYLNKATDYFDDKYHFKKNMKAKSDAMADAAAEKIMGGIISIKDGLDNLKNGKKNGTNHHEI